MCLFETFVRQAGWKNGKLGWDLCKNGTKQWSWQSPLGLETQGSKQWLTQWNRNIWSPYFSGVLQHISLSRELPEQRDVTVQSYQSGEGNKRNFPAKLESTKLKHFQEFDASIGRLIHVTIIFCFLHVWAMVKCGKTEAWSYKKLN